MTYEHSPQPMTCQICARPIKANRGFIAHHGYTRPYPHLQTGSCMGARKLPYEACRATLGLWISALEGMEERALQRLAAIDAETVLLPFEYSRPPVWPQRPVARSVDVCRETFGMVQDAYGNALRSRSIYDFDDLKRRAYKDCRATAAAIQADLTASRERYEAWRKTHRYDGKQWEPV